MTDFRLYCFAQSGNAYKAALTLALSGADWQPIFVDYFGGETRSTAYRTTINEMGEVPVLVHEGRKLSQTGVILTYLAKRLGRFSASNEDEELEILRWMLFDNHKFTSYLATYRFLNAFAAHREPAVMEFLRGRIVSALDIVAKRLDTQPYIAGATPTIADLSLCGYLFFPPEELGFDIGADHPSIAAWLARIKALPGWRSPYDLMPGHPLPGR